MEKKSSEIDSDYYKLLQEFRRNIQDILKTQHDDEFLLTFLRARNFDLRKAERMIRIAQHMRSLYQMDTYVTDFKMPEVAKKYEFTTFLGFDKEGSPVRYISLENADFVGFVMSMSTFEIGCYCEYILEQDRHALAEENKRNGRKAKGYNYIFDMAGFSLHPLFVKPVMETGLDLVKIFQELHPEDVKAIYCVNAPMYFYAAYNIFKPILRLNLLERIHVFSKDSVPGKMLKMISHEILPQSIGGSMVDPDGDPMCPSIIKYGGKVPQELYKMNRPCIQENDPGVKTVLVPARSYYDVAILVEKSGSLLRVEYRSEHYSIATCLLYKPLPFGFISGENWSHMEIKKDDQDAPQMISLHSRIQCHVAPVDVVLFCENPGIYLFRFDNTFSLLQSKRMLYRTEIYPPTE